VWCHYQVHVMWRQVFVDIAPHFPHNFFQICLFLWVLFSLYHNKSWEKGTEIMSDKKNRRIIFFIVSIVTVFMVISLIPHGGGAHPPKEVLLSYDLEAKVLSVTVTHTRFSAGHYIDKIEIMKNGTSVASHSYTNQPSETFSHTYTLDAARGDVINVKATCNKFGSASGKITVE
jgi:hypothetical protein